MPDHRISVRVPERLGKRLRQRSELQGVPESELVREALDTYLNTPQKPQTAYDAALALGIIGCIKGLPSDLSTNPKYMEGFGESRSRRSRAGRLAEDRSGVDRSGEDRSGKDRSNRDRGE